MKTSALLIALLTMFLGFSAQARSNAVDQCMGQFFVDYFAKWDQVTDLANKEARWSLSKDATDEFRNRYAVAALVSPTFGSYQYLIDGLKSIRNDLLTEDQNGMSKLKVLCVRGQQPISDIEIPQDIEK